MITAVDSSVLLDVLTDDPLHREASLAALRDARRLGKLVACPIVWAEVGAFFPDPEQVQTVFSDAGIAFDPLDRAGAELAGQAWRAYRRGGGKRHRLIADFLIAAHAELRADRLLTRDRGFYRTCFRDLQLVEP